MRLKHVLFYAIGIALLYGAVEGLAYLTLRVLRYHKGVTYSPMASSLTREQRRLIEKHLESADGLHNGKHDPLLGWALRPGAVRETVRINRQGIRGDEEYSETPTERGARLCVAGVTVREHESIAVGPDRVLRIEAHGAVPDRVDQRRERHRRAGVSGLGRLHRLSTRV